MWSDLTVEVACGEVVSTKKLALTVSTLSQKSNRCFLWYPSADTEYRHLCWFSQLRTEQLERLALT